MSICANIKEKLSCWEFLEKLGHEVKRSSNMKCPFPDHPGDNSGNFSIFAEGTRWVCQSHHCGGEKGGDVIDLYCHLSYGNGFRCLSPDKKKAALLELAQMAGIECTSAKKHSRIIRVPEAGTKVTFRDKVDSYRYVQFQEIIQSEDKCPACGEVVKVQTSPIHCDEFECTGCCTRGTNADFLSYQTYNRPFSRLSREERKQLEEAWRKLEQDNRDKMLQNSYGPMFDFKVKTKKDGSTAISLVTSNEIAIAQGYCDQCLMMYCEAHGGFLVYDPQTGIWDLVQDLKLSTPLTKYHDQMLRLALAGEGDGNKHLAKRSRYKIGEILKATKAIAVSDAPLRDRSTAIHTRDCMLVWDEEERTFSRMPFAPGYYSCNRTEVAYNPDAKCVTFQKLLSDALSPDDQLLLQKKAGELLLAENRSQTLFHMYGTAGGGKGTIINVLRGIIGPRNCAELRTEHLDSRFEASRYIGKSLLIGNDVRSGFLCNKSASHLKALTGGDAIETEVKNTMSHATIEVSPNIIVTSNGRLQVNVDQDREAWRRRLLLIHFDHPAVDKPIPHFDEKLIAEEGDGILAWMVEGARLLLLDLAEYGKIQLSPAQIKRRDDLLAESDSIASFVNEGLVLVQKGNLTSEQGYSANEQYYLTCNQGCNANGRYYLTCDQVYSGYEQYCLNRGWEAKDKRDFGGKVPALILQRFKVGQSNNIQCGVMTKRGYHNLKLSAELQDILF